jgi:hypothetical protein
MGRLLSVLLAGVSCAGVMSAQTAEELVAKNLQAKGGVEKIKAIHSYRASGKWQQGSLVARVGEDAMEPDLLRTTFTLQGMTAIQAYDGSIGWKISPFQGRKDPQQLGEDDLRDLVEDADLHGPLVDYQQKGHTVEYLGHDTVEGDDALRLKVTLKNGDIVYYYLDPDTYIEIRTERQQFIRGAVRETVTDLGSYKQVAGVYFPFSVESGPKGDPSSRSKITFDKIEVNVSIDVAEFKMPTLPSVPSSQGHPEPAVKSEPKQSAKPTVPE